MNFLVYFKIETFFILFFFNFKNTKGYLILIENKFFSYVYLMIEFIWYFRELITT
jgi:hypothetical protein